MLPNAMAASRLLGAMAACVILLSFAAGHGKLYRSGCIMSARGICQRIFPILVLVIFLLKLFFKNASIQNRVFFPLASRSGFGAAISSALARSSVVSCNSMSADRIEMAVTRLLGATAACVILLSFAAGHRKLYWNGCIKAAIVFQFFFGSCVEIRLWSFNFGVLGGAVRKLCSTKVCE